MSCPSLQSVRDGIVHGIWVLRLLLSNDRDERMAEEGRSTIVTTSSRRRYFASKNWQDQRIVGLWLVIPALLSVARKFKANDEVRLGHIVTSNRVIQVLVELVVECFKRKQLIGRNNQQNERWTSRIEPALLGLEFIHLPSSWRTSLNDESRLTSMGT